jgi:hypothetical protein
MGQRKPVSALPGFEAPIGLVDDVDAALTSHQAIVAVPAAQGFQRIADFHDDLGLLFAGFIRSLPGAVNASVPPVVRGGSLLYSSPGELKPCSVVATDF